MIPASDKVQKELLNSTCIQKPVSKIRKQAITLSFDNHEEGQLNAKKITHEKKNKER